MAAVVVPVCFALTACGSIEREDVVIAGAIPVQTLTTTTPSTTIPPTTESAAASSTTTLVADDGAVADDETADGDEVAVLGASQVQDDDDADNGPDDGADEGAMAELPRTGSTNSVLLLIAIGCAMVVGGRTLVDLMNALTRAIQRSTNATPPPR